MSSERELGPDDLARMCGAIDFGDEPTARHKSLAGIAAAVVGLTVMAGAALVASVIMARAHEALPTAAQPNGWTYPWGCCSNQDCRQAATSEVREVVKGYLLTSTSEIVPYGDPRIKDSPDGLFHTCQVAGDFAKGRVLCLFVPPRSY